MKGGLVLVAGVILMIIIAIIAFAIVVCTVPASADEFYCTPLAPLTDFAKGLF